MKIFVLMTGLLGLLFLLGAISPKTNAKFMNYQFTNSIKGFSILTVVWAHSGARLGVGGIQFIAGIGVALFLICSGFGLEKSFMKNGMDYFWRKRVLRLCIPYWIVQFFGMLITGKLKISSFFKSALFIQTGWFMQYILVCYIVFWICKKIALILNLHEHVEIAIFFVVFMAWFVIDSLFLQIHKCRFLKQDRCWLFPVVFCWRRNKRVLNHILQIDLRKK